MEPAIGDKAQITALDLNLAGAKRRIYWKQIDV
jgi:hypothetical protein